ncbi:orotidine 5'-phosphate decarboxylase [Bifidobacterium sp. UTBIF-68]|nr:orotidine 5'-phosphate decarboxylase [Bifidobacterium sp. UTBIF-68]
MVTPSSEELNAQRSDFGLRLSNSMAKYGPLCVGIDPHRKLLADWGYNVDAEGAELFSMRMLQAASGCAAAVKFQTPMFERYGSKGFEALERVLYAARQMGVITIVDCLHGGLPTTISAIADAYFKPNSPMLADAITLLPYYGARSLNGLISEALDNGRGVFVASLTSNPEGMSLQTAIRQSGDYQGHTVAYGIAATAQKHNVDIEGMGSVGLIIGATIGQWIQDSGVDPSQFTGPILSPGYGWQGAEAKDLKTVFKGTRGNVLVTVSRFIASHGPDISALKQATESIALDVRQALYEAMNEGDNKEKDGMGTNTANANANANSEPAAADSANAAQGDKPKGRLVVLTGPAGVGKGTVENAMRKKHPGVWLSVSATTRKPRPGEVNGVNYWFLTDQEFSAKENKGEFLETALVHGLARYGTPLKPVQEHLAEGVPTLLEIDLQGARRIKERAAELGVDVVYVFIAPPSFDELVRRLKGRGTESEAEVNKRLETAKVELAAENEFDVTIVNDNVDRAADELWSVIAKEYGL